LPSFLFYLVLSLVASGLAIAYVWLRFIVPPGIKGISAATGIATLTSVALAQPKSGYNPEKRESHP
jgi:hypothetical protein